MRRGYDCGFIIDKQVMCGINLGSDFCSEHEWGIRGLRRAFDIEDVSSVWGIERRTIKKVPQNLVYGDYKIDGKEYCVLMKNYISFDALNDFKKNGKGHMPDNFVPYDLHPRVNNELTCAWDENSFGILADKKYEKEMQDLHNAFSNNDIALFVGGGMSFKSGGLNILIVSRIPEKIKKKIFEQDKDNYILERTVEKTGIKEILKKAGKGYYALSPKWKDQKKKEVIFWLNPHEQNIYDFGWFTLQDLKDWANDKGIIIIQKNKSNIKDTIEF